jgi:hypothetical protein
MTVETVDTIVKHGFASNKTLCSAAGGESSFGATLLFEDSEDFRDLDGWDPTPFNYIRL